MMLRHASNRRSRDAIAGEGLRPCQPAGDGGNYPWLDDQPRGIYAVPEGAYDRWDMQPWSLDSRRDSQDIWFFVWCGRTLNDPLIDGAVVVRTDEHIPAILESRFPA